MTDIFSENTKVILDESEMPKHWYNLNADFPEPCAPHLTPATKDPVNQTALKPIFSG